MAATETDAAPVVQEDGKTTEIKATEAEQSANATNSETVNVEIVDKDSVNSEAADNKETLNNDTVVAAAAGADEGEGTAASGEAAAPQDNTSSAEPKTSLLDSFLNKSGLGKVMAGRKKKEQNSATAGAVGDENAAEGGEKEGEKGAEEGEEAEGKTAPENGEEEENKAEKGKSAEPKSTVRDLIRKPVAKIFSHRSNEKKDGTPAECQKAVKVRSKSLDRLEDPEALNAMADAAVEEGGAAGGAEGDQKASAATKHMKRWHSFKKMMAQKTHKKSGGTGEDKEEGAEGESGGRDSSTLDSKDSGQQKRWKLKRSWTFQGLKRDSSIMGISGKAKGSDKDPADNAKTEESAEGGEEAKDDGEAEEAKGEEEKEKVKDEGGEEEKAAGGGSVTQHANEIWTSFKKRVIPKSKRTNTECTPSAEEDATAAAASGEERNTFHCQHWQQKSHAAK